MEVNAHPGERELVSDIAGYCRDPLRYVRYAFPWGEGALTQAQPYQWQVETLNVIGEHLRGPDWAQPLLLSVASGHGIGKSALISWIACWGMSTCDDCRIVVTANTESQLVTKTWPEISRWFRDAINAHWWQVGATTITAKSPGHERTWRMDREAWSENNTEAFAGLHNKGKRVIVLFDESSAISDKIWEVAEGALTDEDTEIIWIAFGNPTQNTGRFFRSFHDLKHRWVNRQIDSRTVPGTNKAQIAKWIADYGEDSDFVRIRVRGEFPREGSKQFIGNELVHEARKRVLEPKDYAGYFKVLSVDVARFGDDQTVIGERQGPKLVILDSLRGLSVVETARRVMYWMRERNPRATIIDGDGIGGGVVDIIRDALPDLCNPERQVEEWAKAWAHRNPNHDLQEFHGGGTPNDVFMYFNKRAECWGLAKRWLETADVPDLPELETDLTGVQYGFSAKNQLQLERKEDMKKRGLASPDLGDMIAQSFAAFPALLTEEEKLGRRLASIEDPLWRHVVQVKATLDKDREREEDNRPEWMR